MIQFSDLQGKTLANIEGKVGSEKIVFTTIDNERYIIDHYQDCCESVTIEDIVGDLGDLIGNPVLMAEEVVNEGNVNPEGVTIPEYQDSFTWTFYKLATIKGYVTIRWYGASNGYYSERVDFYKENDPIPYRGGL